MTESFKLRGANVRRVSWRSHRSELESLRTIVFIEEQAVPTTDEWDGMDDVSTHFLAERNDGTPVGCARLMPDGQVGRLAVLEAERRQGIGRQLMEAVIEFGERQSIGPLHLHAQLHAIKLYESLGFSITGDVFLDAGIEHVPMRLTRTASPSPALETYGLGEAALLPITDQVTELSRREFLTILGLEARGLSRFTAQDTEFFVIARSETPLGGAAITKAGDIIFFSTDLDDDAVQLLLHALIARAQRYGWLSLNLSPLGHRSTAIEKALEGTQYATHKTLIPIGQPKQREREGAVRYEVPEQWSLGLSDKNHWFTTHEQFTVLVRAMLASAQREIFIHSPTLLHDWASDKSVLETLASLARAHRSTSVKILVWEVPALIKNNAPMLELSRKLSSSIQIKEVDSTHRNYPGEFIVVDKTSLAVQQDPYQPLGWVNPKAIARAREKERLFQSMWSHGLHNPNLRQMHI